MRRALAALAVVLAVAGCSSSSDGDADRLTLERSTTTTAPPLADHLPETVLDGFHRADAAFGGGALDLGAAADASQTPAKERASLREHGFVRGVARSWVNITSADTVYVALYQFADDAGAAGYAADAAAEITAAGGTPFAGGFTTVEHAGTTTLTAHAAIRQEGRFWALALVTSQVADRTPEEAVQVAAAIRL